MNLKTEYGKKIAGRIVYMPRSILTESVPGAVYQLEMKTKGVPDPKKVISALITELPKRFKDLKVLWIEVRDPYIRMQIRGSPFSWAALLAALPLILLAVGVVLLLVSVYLVFAAVPSWVYGLLVVGALISYGAYKFMAVSMEKE